MTNSELSLETLDAVRGADGVFGSSFGGILKTKESTGPVANKAPTTSSGETTPLNVHNTVSTSVHKSSASLNSVNIF